MPDQSKSISAPIPRRDPALWEEHEGFRETLLLQFSDPQANAVLRGAGQLLFNLALECAHLFPDHAEGSTRSEVRAALADLRHLEGFLSSVGKEHILSNLSADDAELSEFAASQAVALGRIADQIEEELDHGRDEEN